MKFILAGWLTVGLALLWDRFLSFIGTKQTIRVGILVPAGEELLKFGVSYLNHLYLPFLYALFGFGEGVYESIFYKRKLNLNLVLAGILTHTSFSIFFLFNLPVWLSLILAIISHSFWNLTILNLKNDCKRSSN